MESSAENHELEPVFIKTEVLIAEENSHDYKEELCQAYMGEETAVEETGLDLDISKYKCNFCHEFFSNEFILKSHIIDNHRNDPIATTEEQNEVKVYKCEHSNCGKSFVNHCKFLEHVVVHSNLKRFHCKHADCTKSFKQRKELKAHMIIHSDEKPFKCGEEGCTMSYKRKRDLTHHIVVHSYVKPYKCEQAGCTESFRKKIEWEIHNAMHSDKEIFRCEEAGCSRTFKQKSRLVTHMLVHTDIKPFECSFSGCAKKFKTINYLKAHLVSHSDKATLRCTYDGCQQTFKWRSKLATHQKTHQLDSNATGILECSKFVRNDKRCIRRQYLHGSIVDEETSGSNEENCSETTGYNLTDDDLESHNGKEESTDKKMSSKQFSICGEKFNASSNSEEQAGECSENFKWEFVDVDKIDTQELNVDLKLKLENVD